ncbi:MAG: hypothetical protein M0R06_09965 [Sphaerochaeta sp.]|jgi:hypothetical protein|uniref:hypothetical protein n=1 Tax=unclassified Sphaerochaeta TaxID=2637943 RepID=UPI002A367BBF|nr:hypothetical protein [Sphaerochaeta sp.]MCK9599355.1 hypothetical protein [Sphaerochaeta sp.]MDX9825502.1 hypothetical protein [Sphaerochaeta sp.]
MKKMFVLVLLVPMLTIAFISCDADMRSNLAGFMGNFGGNVYVESGLVEASIENVEAVKTLATSLGTGSGVASVSGGGTTSEFGTSVTVPAGVTVILIPQNDDDRSSLNNKLADAIASPDEEKALVEAMKNPATSEQQTAVVGTVATFNATLQSVIDDLDSSDENDAKVIELLETLAIPTPDAEGITQGDVVVLQMMANIVKTAVETIESSTDPTDDELIALAADASFTALIAGKLTDSTSIDFSGQLSLQSLLDSYNSGT